VTNKFDFSEAELIGSVISVDTSRVWINVTNHVLVTRIGILNLVAVQGFTATEYLIGVVDRVTRDVESEALLEQESAQGVVPIEESQKDLVRIVLIGTFYTVQGEKHNIFKRGADSFPQIDRKCYIIEAGNLQTLMNCLSEEIEPEKRLHLGHFVVDKKASAVADGNRFFQRHAALLGSTGSGKSWTVALILERASALSFPNLIVLDMHGEYTPLTQKGGFATAYRIASPGDLEQPSEDVVFLPYWLLNREEMLAMILDRSDSNAPNQASRFTHHVRDLKSEALKTLDKKDVLETFTVDSPVPYRIEELLARLEDDDTGEKAGRRGDSIKGDWNGKLTRFIARLTSKLEDRRYGFLFKPPSASLKYSWLSELAQKFFMSGKDKHGIKIIDFSSVPSDVLPVVTGVFARFLYDVQFWMSEEKRTPLTLVCDEAHLYLPVKDQVDPIELRAVENFERIAKEGRKYGVSLLVVSQRPSDVSRTILSQCNNFIVLRLTNDQDQNVVKRLMPDSMAGLTEILPLLDTGEALMLGDAVLLPTRVRLTKPKIQPSSATRDFWTEWSNREPDKEAIFSAVEHLRKQTRK
jgi:uncharacterized protein